MKSYRAAIIGLSEIGAAPPHPGPVHPALGAVWPHSHAAAYAVLPNVEVVAVCDLKQELLDGFRSNFGTRWPAAHAYTDYLEMLKRERIDVLSVATPDHLHAQIVVDAAEGGVRGIFCEKPIATSLADADRMIEACDRHGAVIAIDHTRRLRPLWHAALAQLGEGPLGKPRRLFGTCSGQYAKLFYNATHLVDAVCWFAREKPEWVVAALDEEQRGYGPRYNGDGNKTPGLDPGGSAIVQFDNGVRAFINCSTGTSSFFELQVFAERGRLRVDDVSADVWVTSTGYRGLTHSSVPVPLPRIAEIPAGIADVIDAMEQGHEPISTAQEARMALSILLAMLQSQAAGNTPVPFPVADR